MVLSPSSRAEGIRSFLVMDLLDAARAQEGAGRRIYHLEVGEPDLPTPEPILAATIEALRMLRTHYAPSMGEEALRQAIAEEYASQGIAVDPEQILVSNGSSPLLYASLLAVVEPGSEVILTDPTYPCYPNFVRMVGGVVRTLPLDPEEGFRPDFRKLRRLITPRTRALVINTPSNPTGVALSPEELQELLDLGVWVIVDEIYRGIQYPAPTPSALSLKAPHVLVVDGFSKRYAMTGFRLGYMVIPPPLIPVLKAIHQNLMISANEFVQWGGIAALKDPAVKRTIATWILTLKERRDLLIQGFRELGIPIPAIPEGAFYLLGDFRFARKRSLELAYELLDKYGIAVTPGEDFGTCTQGFLRFSFATRREDILAALSQLQLWKESLGRVPSRSEGK